MPTPVIALLLAMALAAITAAVSGRLLRWFPVPDGEPRADFVGLDSPRFRLGVGAVGFLVGSVLLVLTAPPLWPILAPLAALGSLLGLIDVRTTYLPLRLHYLTFALVGAGVAISAWWRAEPWSLVWAAGIGLGTTGVYSLVWWISRGQLGFGDVRLAGLIGVATGAISGSLTTWTLLLGSLVGAVWAIGSRARGVRQFPYGPSMLIGLPLAVIMMQWMR